MVGVGPAAKTRRLQQGTERWPSIVRRGGRQDHSGKLSGASNEFIGHTRFGRNDQDNDVGLYAVHAACTLSHHQFQTGVATHRRRPERAPETKRLLARRGYHLLEYLLGLVELLQSLNLYWRVHAWRISRRTDPVDRRFASSAFVVCGFVAMAFRGHKPRTVDRCVVARRS